MQPDSKLRLVKLVHTAVWAVFAACILAIPVHTYRGDLQVSAVLVGIVMLEVIVLAFNRMACPLTSVAARYTMDRKENFDIYLPLWLARWNKHVFGTLFVAGVVYTLVMWMLGRAAT